MLLYFLDQKFLTICYLFTEAPILCKAIWRIRWSHTTKRFYTKCVFVLFFAGVPGGNDSCRRRASPHLSHEGVKGKVTITNYGKKLTNVFSCSVPFLYIWKMLLCTYLPKLTFSHPFFLSKQFPNLTSFQTTITDTIFFVETIDVWNISNKFFWSISNKSFWNISSKSLWKYPNKSFGNTLDKSFWNIWDK